MHADTKLAPANEDDRLVTGKEVEVIIGVSCSKRYQIQNDPAQNFPKAIRLSSRMVRFSRNAVLRWVDNKAAVAQGSQVGTDVQAVQS